MMIYYEFKKISCSRELQIFNARKPLYAFDKDFTLNS